MDVKGVGKGGDGTELPSPCRPLISGVARGWTGVDMSTPLLLEVAPEIDTNPTSFYRGGVGGSLRFQTPVIGSRSALAMSVHPTYFDLATPLYLIKRNDWHIANA